jgi:tRNA A-37 threonylcarbamoyl transferase component Bud32
VDKHYEVYCLKDRLFYDVLDGQESPAFAIADDPLPGGWQRIPRGEWVVYVPPEHSIPAQGWKIHVSASHDNAADVLVRVRDYCIPRGISFKHLRSVNVLLMRNAKYSPRGASGKLVTVYPRDDAELATILDELDAELAGEPGPYVLSDLRIGAGPLYVRYGGFAERHCEDESGRLVPAIEDGEGRLVPDRRDPVFTVPSWVTLPDCLAPHLAARNAVTMAGVPYRITEALHFSNGGGVYAGEDTRTGRRVVLKEGRPYAGLAADGADAVARVRREHDVLRLLAGIDGVPEALDYVVGGEHHFLVEEFVEGRPLNTFFAERHPLLDPEPDPGGLADYAAWAMKIYAGAERVIEQVHARGVAFNDLRMFNIMVAPDDTVSLIDFEAAAPAAERRRQTLANPGFLAPPDRRGTDVDAYGLACLKIALFTPTTNLFMLDLGKAAHLAEVIAEWFPVPAGYLDQAVAEITRGEPSRPKIPRFAPEPPGWERARDALRTAILASATPQRDDRLFPGDIQPFGGGALGLAYGAAGVLYALDVTGCGAVGYAFARPALFGDTIAAAIGRDAESAARAARADPFIRRLPLGYRTPPSEAPMSGGELQRLGLARAFAHPGRVLVLDDATSSLDTVTEVQVGEVLTRDGRTRLIIAHRVGTAARADLVAWLDGGRVRACAPHHELWPDPEYREVFGE